MTLPADTRPSYGTRSWLRDALVVAGGGLLVFAVVSWLVVTDKERIELLLDEGMRAFAARDVEGCLVLLSPHCQITASGGDHVAAGTTDIRALLEEMFRTYGTVGIEMKKREILVGETGARTNFVTKVHVQGHSLEIQGDLVMRGLVKFEQTAPSVWKATRIEIIETRGVSG
jgi:hypothetical protein